jgi:hypothetical protein
MIDITLIIVIVSLEIDICVFESVYENVLARERVHSKFIYIL